MRLGGRRARGRNRSGGACNRTVRVAASQPEAAIGARSKRVSPKRLRLGFVLLRFARAVVAFVSLDRSSGDRPSRRVRVSARRALARASRVARARAPETESQTRECTPRSARSPPWRRRRPTFGSSSRRRRTCASRECTPARVAAPSRVVVLVSHPASTRRRLFARASRFRARVVPRAFSRGPPHPSFALDRVPRALRVVAAPVRPRRPSRFSSCASRVARTRSRRVVPRRRSRRT